MNILGFSGIERGQYYQDRYAIRFVGHDSSAALVRDGRVIFAAEEERFSRRKHTSALPIHAIEWGLAREGMTLDDIDAVAYSWHADPRRIFHMYLHHPARIPARYWPELALAGHRVLRDLMSPRVAARSLRRAIGPTLPPVRGVAHHLAHAACAYFTSPFDDAAVLTVDGQGEDESATLGEWRGSRYTHFRSTHSPDSIGILYGMITDFLGMRAAWDEYKVMAMAAMGDPARFASAFDRLVRLRPNGRYSTFRTAMVFKPGYCDRLLAHLLGVPKRAHTDPLEQVHLDIAAALQSKLEATLFHLLRHLRARSTSSNLCLAGGVFLNSVANGKIRRSGLFDRVHVPPVPGDHGGALGAAVAAHYALSGADRTDLGFSPFLGPDLEDHEIERVLDEAHSRVAYVKTESPARDAADLLARDKIIAWCQGRMEYGPRALGHRSILASPVRKEMRDIVNRRIKHREEFRPFAGAVPVELAPRYFDIAGESPNMQFVLPVRPEAESIVPAVVHHGTCRVQTVARDHDPGFHELLHAFGELTGVPIVLNTSFNDYDEPIVCTASDAVRTFLATDLDALILGSFVVTRRAH